MGLKSTLANKAEVDALELPLRPLYVEREGKFVLDVEGMVPSAEVHELRTKVAEFRDNNIAVTKERDTLKATVSKFEGIDPEEHKTIKAEYDKLKGKGVKSEDDLQKAIAAAIKPISDKLAEESSARAEAQKRADDATFRELFSTDAKKVGVRPASLRHVLREASEKFTLKDGSIVPKEGVKHPTDPLKTLTTEEWLQQLVKTDEYLFEPSVGGGANGGGSGGSSGGGGGNARKIINPTPEEMGRNMDDIASGKAVVVRH